MNWKIVNDSWKKTPIGAIGFIGDEIAVVGTFYEDSDFNNDGKTDLKERFLMPFSMRGRALANVLSHAYADPKIATIDSSLAAMRGRAVQAFAGGMLVEGVYLAYFKRGVGSVAGSAAKALVKGPFARFVVKKGMGSMVKSAYQKAAR
ncbi:MAG: hypothetical protein AAF756_05940 [Pseudomonadota bacterium]